MVGLAKRIKQAKQKWESKYLSSHGTRLVKRSIYLLTASLLQTTTPLASQTSSWGREGGRKEGILKVASKLLKIGYVQVETPKFPRPCTLACNCKIIWDSEFDKVGGFPRKFQSYPVGEAFSKITLNFNLNKDFPVNWKSTKWFVKLAKNWICIS